MTSSFALAFTALIFSVVQSLTWVISGVDRDMGAVLPGPGTPVSGSVGAITYSRNRFGAYTRPRTKPVNPNSNTQNIQRSLFRSAVENWSSVLNGVQRDAWRAWADNTPWLNKAGETVHLTGQNAYIRHATAWGTNLGGIPATGLALLPPPQNDVGSILIDPTGDELELDVATQEFTISFNALALDNSSGVANGVFLVDITPGLNAGVTFPGNRWALGRFGGAPGVPWTAGALDITAAPTVPWSYQVGQFIFFRFRGIGSFTTGVPNAERRVTTQQILGPFAIVAAA